jgi:hypothetical protein
VNAVLSKTKYEKLSKEAGTLLTDVSGGMISTPRIIKFLREFTDGKKPKKDHRSILENRIK